MKRTTLLNVLVKNQKTAIVFYTRRLGIRLLVRLVRSGPLSHGAAAENAAGDRGNHAHSEKNRGCRVFTIVLAIGG